MPIEAVKVATEHARESRAFCDDIYEEAKKVHAHVMKLRTRI